jgi:hypothetical protein
MKISFVKFLHAAVLTILFWATTVYADNSQQMKMTTPIAPGVAVPDKVATSIGTLTLNYGYPDDATTQKVYDNLDASRALQAYLLAIPIVNQAGMRDSLRQFGRTTRRM